MGFGVLGEQGIGAYMPAQVYLRKWIDFKLNIKEEKEQEYQNINSIFYICMQIYHILTCLFQALEK